MLLSKNPIVFLQAVAPGETKEPATNCGKPKEG
jgi:hypothetical protein